MSGCAAAAAAAVAAAAAAAAAAVELGVVVDAVCAALLCFALFV